MKGHLSQEEPLGEDDLKVFTKDRVKKDNHNMSEIEKRLNPPNIYSFLYLFS